MRDYFYKVPNNVTRDNTLTLRLNSFADLRQKNKVVEKYEQLRSVESSEPFVIAKKRERKSCQYFLAVLIFESTLDLILITEHIEVKSLWIN